MLTFSTGVRRWSATRLDDDFDADGFDALTTGLSPQALGEGARPAFRHIDSLGAVLLGKCIDAAADRDDYGQDLDEQQHGSSDLRRHALGLEEVDLQEQSLSVARGARV